MSQPDVFDSEMLGRFCGRKILVLGDLMLDEYVSGSCTRISPEAPVPVLRVDSFRHVLGGAANTAANIASLKGQAVLIGLLGQDADGERFRALCEKAGIRLEAVFDGRCTPKKTRLVGQRQQLLRLDYEQSHYLDARAEESVWRIFERELPDAGMVVLSDYAKGLLTEALCRRIIEAAHRQGKEVIADPRPQHARFYRGCDVLTPNWKESLGLLGLPEEEPATPETTARVGERLRRELGAGILMTLSDKGMVFFGREGGEPQRFPTEAREVFDVSGAGDTVVATFALARACAWDHETCIRLANRAAGIVVGKFGTATVSPEELLQGAAEKNRLVPRDALAPLSKQLKARGKRVVSLNGSFDLLHAGHLHILEEAARQGDILVVGLNSDASVKRYKSPGRPIISQEHRARMLLALRSVDFVHIFDEDVPMPFLEELEPDVHVNGSEYGAECIEAETVKRHGGRIHIVDKVPGLSTSEVIGRILESERREPPKT